jgi:hypothetical protein
MLTVTLLLVTGCALPDDPWVVPTHRYNPQTGGIEPHPDHGKASRMPGDRYECAHQVTTATTNVFLARQLFRWCMLARGYTIPSLRVEPGSRGR